MSLRLRQNPASSNLSHGERNGRCSLVLHEDQKVVIDVECAYCKAGMNTKRALSSLRLRGGLAVRIEHNLISNKSTVIDSTPLEADVPNKTMDTGIRAG